ncbi:hypothetical protein CCACVL1_13506 [Corchorus capsularis]|uniref:Uncharacterized protein n=1 Tax=Corchorus capsularis TaxID=210143 RepID=A0A1R3IAU7_COCAP|nr:hypothetical protein CCACVL1_13506 [Corchorus capsularis]
MSEAEVDFLHKVGTTELTLCRIDQKIDFVGFWLLSSLSWHVGGLDSLTGLDTVTVGREQENAFSFGK